MVTSIIMTDSDIDAMVVWVPHDLQLKYVRQCTKLKETLMPDSSAERKDLYLRLKLDVAREIVQEAQHQKEFQTVVTEPPIRAPEVYATGTCPPSQTSTSQAWSSPGFSSWANKDERRQQRFEQWSQQQHREYLRRQPR